MLSTILKILFSISTALLVVLLKEIWGLLKMIMGVQKMTDDSEVTFDWNGETIHFSHWRNQPPGIYEYTTRNQRHHFKFNLVKKGSEVRIYILEQPDYGLRETGGHPTHRLEDGKGKYVCVHEDHTPANVPDALSWLIDWSEKTARYIDTGTPLQPGD